MHSGIAYIMHNFNKCNNQKIIDKEGKGSEYWRQTFVFDELEIKVKQDSNHTSGLTNKYINWFLSTVIQQEYINVHNAHTHAHTGMYIWV